MKENRKITKVVTIYPDDANLDVVHSEWTKPDERNSFIEEVANNIGWVIIEFNLLEYNLLEILKYYLCESTYTSSLMFNLVSEKTFTQRVDVLKSFYKQHYQDRKEEFDESNPNFENEFSQLINNLKEAGGLRNKYAHCFWHTIDEDRIVEFKTEIDKEGTKIISVKFSKEDMQTDFDLLQDTQIELDNFNSAFLDVYDSH